MSCRFFVVDDDQHYARLLSYRLEKGGNEVQTFSSGPAVLAALKKASDQGLPDLILLEIMMPGMDGVEVLKRIRSRHMDVMVVMVSAQGAVEVAVDAMKGGANDYIAKGQNDLVRLDLIVKSVKERASLRREAERLRGEAADKYGIEELMGESPAMDKVYRLVQKTLRGNLTVALHGESGTGKELAARAIHFNSRPREGQKGPGPFVVVNCAAIPRELMESEFFGHEKGSFTGAVGRHIGKFEQSDGGTIFLDEIGELDLKLQAKLLRALQNREVTRVGGNDLIRFDCRVISATNRDILQMVADGSFREDLYYRLFQFPIQLPPLRDRGQDLIVLAHHFLKKYVEAHPDLGSKVLSRRALRAINGYHWPGNVRELKNVVERAALIADSDQVEDADLMLDLTPHVVPWGERGGAAPRNCSWGDGALSAPPQRAFVAAPYGVQQTAAEAETVREAVASPNPVIPLEDIKRQAVENAFHACEGNAERAAGELGIGRATMYRLLKKYDLAGE